MMDSVCLYLLCWGFCFCMQSGDLELQRLFPLSLLGRVFRGCGLVLRSVKYGGDKAVHIIAESEKNDAARERRCYNNEKYLSGTQNKSG